MQAGIQNQRRYYYRAVHYLARVVLDTNHVWGELLASRAALAALLGIIETRLEEDGGAVGELRASGDANVQSRLESIAVEQGTVAADVGGVHAHPQPEVVTVPGDVLVAVAADGLHAGIVSISIARLCHGG